MHKNLIAVVKKHQASVWRAPIAEHNVKAFQHVMAWLEQAKVDPSEPLNNKIIVDTGCGVGQSTRTLAAQNPNQMVIGVDKSLDRLNRQHGDVPSNAILIRADLADFWRLAAQADWHIAQHYFLYPNPWPKPAHLQRRWHGHPVLPAIVALSGQIISRSNWRTYLDEFAAALACYGINSDITKLDKAASPLTPFEAKYQDSEQICWQLQTQTIT